MFSGQGDIAFAGFVIAELVSTINKRDLNHAARIGGAAPAGISEVHPRLLGHRELQRRHAPHGCGVPTL
jgi:hypothetical protein